jgi:zona occludens toxin (predicted ATPase)
MKKILLLFTDFRFARNLIGGTWYYVYDVTSDFGLAGDTRHWTQTKPSDKNMIIKSESYQ